MPKYRNALPQLGPHLYLSDGGIETTLIFLEHLDLPDFAAFHLLRTPEGDASLKKYFRTYAEIAKRFGTGLILESATWRASTDWGKRLGYTAEELASANRRAIQLLEEIQSEYESAKSPMVISGCVGPRGDGYVPDRAMSAEEAATFHGPQVEALSSAGADMASAITMNYAAEASGVALAAKRADLPVAISFTVETDGKLPTGQTLKSAIEEVDEVTSGYPRYYMINCAHPTHFEKVFDQGGSWLDRISGLRANASKKSHAELNESPELDIGDPAELAAEYATLTKKLPKLNVMGGCCGTDHRHLERIAEACVPLFRATG